MDDVRRTLLGGVFAALAVVAVVIAMMSRTDGDTTDLGVNQPLAGASASDGLRAQAQAAGADGRAREIRSGFPEPDLGRLGAVAANERVHDPRSAL